MRIDGCTRRAAASTGRWCGGNWDACRGVSPLLAVLALVVTACGSSGSRGAAHRLPGPTPTAANADLTVYVNSDVLYALRASDGALRWTAQGVSLPAIVDGVLYGEVDGTVEALDAATRAVRWRHTINSWLGLWPAVADGVVYVSSSQAQKNGPPIGGSVYALRASDGMLQWRQPIDGRGTTPAVADGVVYVGAEAGTLYAFATQDGALRWAWRYQAGPQGETAYPGIPVVVAGTVYVGVSVYLGIVPNGPPPYGFVYALDARSGALRWQFRTQYAIPQAVVVAQ